MHIHSRSEFYGSLVWIFSAATMFTYISLAFLGYNLPGVEQLLTFLNSLQAEYIYLAAFLAIFIEGLYFVGSLFPGSTLVVLVAVLSQTGGILVFLATILSIFIGWCAAGAVNIFLAKNFRVALSDEEQLKMYEVKDRLWTTWFPAFRASYEVAQVSEGADPTKVFFSSVRVKIYASLAAAMITLIIPFVVDIHEMSNEEGFTTVGIVAFIALTVGIVKLRNSMVGVSPS